MQINDFVRQIDEITNNFSSTFGHLTNGELNWKPDESVWSIAQIVEHLIVINSTYFPIIHDTRKGNYTLPFIAKFPFMVRFFGNMILKSVQPDRRRKMKTFKIWEPSQSEISGDILSRFRLHQEELKQLIDSSQDLISRGVLISSPANKMIVYKLETAFEIIITHERRHFEQAKELFALITK